jgi:hypothetical protein
VQWPWPTAHYWIDVTAVSNLRPRELAVLDTEPLTAFDLADLWTERDRTPIGGQLPHVSLHSLPPWDEICSDLNWVTYRLNGGYFTAKEHGQCGVYRLVALTPDEDLKKPASFNRVCGQDTTGTLYIGEGKILHERLNALRRSRHRHKAILSLRKIPVLDLPDKRLAIAVLFTIRDTKYVERTLIEAYMNSFGDTPPLNYKL